MYVMYVCMHVCMYVGREVGRYASVRTYKYTMILYVYIYIHEYIHTHIYVSVVQGYNLLVLAEKFLLDVVYIAHGKAFPYSHAAVCRYSKV